MQTDAFEALADPTRRLIVETLRENANATITVDSKQDAGTTVTIDFARRSRPLS